MYRDHLAATHARVAQLQILLTLLAVN